MSRLHTYLNDTHPGVIFFDAIRAVFLIGSVALGIALLQFAATQTYMVAPLHRRLWASPAYTMPLWIYGGFIVLTVFLNIAWMTTALRNFVVITMKRRKAAAPIKEEEIDKEDLPPYPYTREGFAVVVGELQARDGKRVPNKVLPELHPRWLILPEKALVTGIFVTGGIGSGKTASAAYPFMRQMVGHERPVKVIDRPATPDRPEVSHTEKYKWSGLLLDEKGDFFHTARGYAQEWGREEDMVLIRPDGPWKWNVIYNPNIPDWAVAYQLGWILKNVNKGAGGNDPFWEQAPRALLVDLLTMLGDAEGYYTILEYLNLLTDESLQDEMQAKSLITMQHNPDRLLDATNRGKRIQMRRERMGVNLRGSLEACAKAGLDMFEGSALRRTFCPPRESYFTGPCCPWPRRIPRNEAEEARFNSEEQTGIIRPQDDVFTGFDQALDYGKIVGLEMNKQTYFDAAIFIQVALKTQWMDAVMRRDVRDSATNKLLVPPRFGEKIGYCPTFLIADECQANATPRDQEFMAQCRSKKASCMFLTQSHTSILDAFGGGKEKAAEAFFQNTMTHIYFRQSDLKSMKMIQEEVGMKDVAKTSVSVTEGGRETELSYVQGQFVNEHAAAVSETKSVNIEEKPFFKVEELKQLPDFVSVILPSTGSAQLPATTCYMRPLWVFKKHPELKQEQSYFDWPQELRRITTLENLPQEVRWSGFDVDSLAAESIVSSETLLGAFVRQADAGAGHYQAAPPVQVDSDHREQELTYPQDTPAQAFTEEPEPEPAKPFQPVLAPEVQREAERLATEAPQGLSGDQERHHHGPEAKAAQEAHQNAEEPRSGNPWDDVEY